MSARIPAIADGRKYAYDFSFAPGYAVDDRDTFTIWDDFLYQTLTEADTPWVLSNGADAQAIDPAINAQEGGVVRLTTGNVGDTFANDGAQMTCHIPVQADSGGLYIEARLHINTAITNTAVFVGLTDVTTLEMPFANASDSITSNAADACGFLYDTDATTDEWWALAVDSNTDDTGNVATGTAPTADTYQVLGIKVSSDGNRIEYSIDGAIVKVLEDTGGVSPSVNLFFTIAADSHTTASATVDVDYVLIRTSR